MASTHLGKIYTLIKAGNIVELQRLKLTEEEFKKECGKNLAETMRDFGIPNNTKLIHVIIDTDNNQMLDYYVTLNGNFDVSIELENVLDEEELQKFHFTSRRNSLIYPLQYAVIGGKTNMVKSLYNENNYNKGMCGGSTFITAAEIANKVPESEVHTEIVRILLSKRGEDILSEIDHNGFFFINWYLSFDGPCKKALRSEFKKYVNAETLKPIINNPNRNGKTAIMIEVQKKANSRTERNIKFMLDANANIHIKDTDGNSALDMTAQKCNAAALTAMVKKFKPDEILRVKSNEDKYLIQVAFENENSENMLNYMKVLCDNDFDFQFNIKHHGCNDLLIECILKNNEELLVYLIERKNVNCFEKRYEKQKSAFMKAIVHRKPLMCKTILRLANRFVSNEKLLTLEDENGDTAMFHAVRVGDFNSYKELIELSAAEGEAFLKDVLTKKNKKGFSIIMIAALHSHREIVKDIFETSNSCRINQLKQRTPKGDNMLSLCAYAGNKEMLEYFNNEVQRIDADILQLKNEAGNTVLLSTAISGQKDAVEYVHKDLKANITETNNVGNYFTHNITVKKKENSLLFDYAFGAFKAGFDKRNKAGQTPFLYCCDQLNDKAIITFCSVPKFKRYISHKDPNLKNGLQILTERLCILIDVEGAHNHAIILNKFKEVVEHLIDNQLHKNEDIFNHNFLQATVRNNNIIVFRFMLNCLRERVSDYKYLLINKENTNVLHLVCQFCDYEEWEKYLNEEQLLIDSDDARNDELSISKQDNRGANILHFACAGGNAKNIKLILERSKNTEEYTNWNFDIDVRTTKTNQSCFDLALEAKKLEQYSKGWKEATSKKSIVDLLYKIDSVTDSAKLNQIGEEYNVSDWIMTNSEPYVINSIRYSRVQAECEINEVDDELHSYEIDGIEIDVDAFKSHTTSFNCAVTMISQAISTNDDKYLLHALNSVYFKLFESELSTSVNKDILKFFTDKEGIEVLENHHPDTYGFEKIVKLITKLLSCKQNNESFPKKTIKTNTLVENKIHDDGLPFPIFALLMGSFKVVPLLLTIRHFDVIPVGLQVLCLIDAAKKGILTLTNSADKCDIDTLISDVQHVVITAVNTLYKDVHVQRMNWKQSSSSTKKQIYDYMTGKLGGKVEERNESETEQKVFYYGPRYSMYYNDQEYTIIELAEACNFKEFFETTCIKQLWDQKWNNPIYNMNNWFFELFNVEEHKRYTNADKYVTKNKKWKFQWTPKFSFVMHSLLHLAYLVMLLFVILRPHNGYLFTTFAGFTIYLGVEELEVIIRQWYFQSAKNFKQWKQLLLKKKQSKCYCISLILHTFRKILKIRYLKKKLIHLWLYYLPDYIKNIWNLLHLTGLIIVSVGLISYIAVMNQAGGIPGENHVEASTFYVPRLILAYGFFFLTFKILDICRYFRRIGILVAYSKHVVKRDLYPVIFLLFIVAVAFGVIYSTFLYPLGYFYDADNKNAKYNYYQIPEIISPLFRKIFGEAEDELERNCLRGDETSQQCPNKFGIIFTRYVIDLLFLVIANLLIFNLLIGQVNYTVRKKSIRVEATWRFYRYKILAEYSAKLPFLFVNAIIYLICLLYLLLQLLAYFLTCKICLRQNGALEHCETRLCNWYKNSKIHPSNYIIRQQEQQNNRLVNKWWQSVSMTIESIDNGNATVENLFTIQSFQLRQKRATFLKNK